MSTNKNPLRQLASAIVTATQAAGAKGVKQSVVLDTLTKFEGFRSIQASDAATKTSTTGETPPISPEIILAQAFLFSAYPNTDLFGVSLNSLIGKTLQGDTAHELGDPLFVSLWNTLTQNHKSFTSYLLQLRESVTTLYDDFPDDDVESCEFTLFLPADIANFINVEYQESGKPLYQVIERLLEDLDHVHEIIEENGFWDDTLNQEGCGALPVSTVTIKLGEESPLSLS